MSSKFITNQEKLLSDVMNNIMPSAENFYCLVGYFYFSGFMELAENIKDKKVRILIGMEIERKLGKVIKEIDWIRKNENKIASNKDLKQKYYSSLVDLFGHTDLCEGSNGKKAFKIFLEKIKNGSLEIKKTRESNHAKLYIFEKKKEYSDGGETPGIVITGSSNLTISGLKNRFEINVKSSETDDFEMSKELFKELWDKSVVIADKNNIKEFTKEVIEKIWIAKLPKPYLVYIRVLYELFNIPDKNIKLPSKIAGEHFFDLEYQKDAINKGLDIIEKHSGVIIADVVGLGKSIIASAIAYNLGLQTIVICPPHLKKQWEEYGRSFKFKPEVYSSGSIHKALKDYENIDGAKLIIIDEAHKYRNELTRDYDNLKKLCSDNKILLLTATPFNNKPQDIFAIISLFQIATKSTIRTVDNLANRFKELVIEYKKIRDIKKEEEKKVKIKRIADKIRDVIFPVVVRRSRIDLKKNKKYKKDLEKQGIEFSKVQPPKLLKYELGEMEEKYIDTLDKIINEDKGFIGARYKPTSYIKEDKIKKYEKEFEYLFKDKSLLTLSQRNVAKFMRRLLVHRFESSVHAFGSTLDNMVKSMELIEKWYLNIGKVPILKKGNLIEAENLQSDSSDNNEELKELDADLEKLKKEKGYYYIDAKDLKEDFIKYLQKDIKLLKDVKKEWFEDIDVLEKDPKIEKIKLALSEKMSENPNRKIIIFTGYSDTADHIYNKIKDDFRVFRYSSKYASAKNKEIIKTNFDAGCEKSEQNNDYDILVATDAISEGFNLHRAGIVINYDIPYNPTRVIQRIGRINRINKKVFDELFIYNCFPSLTGEKEVKIKEIATLKIDMINALLGNDTKTLTEEEEVESYYRKKYNEIQASNEEESWDQKYQEQLSGISKEILEEAKSDKVIPFRTKIKRTVKKEKAGILIFAKKDTDYIFKLSNGEGEAEILERKKVLELLEADILEKPAKVSESFYDIFDSLKESLFRNNKKLKSDKSDRDLANKIEKLREKFSKEKDYLGDLFIVAVELKALSGYDERYIRNLKMNKNAVDNLKKQIKYSYIQSKINQAKKIDDGEETLILAEELI